MATIEDSIKLQLARATLLETGPLETGPMAGMPRGAPAKRVFRATSGEATCLQNLAGDARILVGNAGDNPLVQQLLVQAYQLPLSEDFQSRLDEPLYEPSDRLLLQRAGRLIGHVQVSKLIGWFDGFRCPLVRLQDFITLPEYRSNEFDAPLLELAESVAVNEGAILGFARTDRPEWFQQHDWSCCRGQGHTRANTRAILSHLASQQANRRDDRRAIEVRTWRHFQIDSISKIYQQLSTNMWGSFQRSLETWQWLVGRKAHDQILIAVKEPSGSRETAGASDLANQPNVVGYAVIRDSCIVELLTLPGHSEARSALLVQACRDAIDGDHHFVSLHTPAADPMHELLVTAGGSWIADSAASSGKWMLKLLAPDRWVERLYPRLHERAREAEMERPLKIDFAVDQRYQRLTLTRRSARLEPIPHSAVAVHCNRNTFQDLLTSNLTFPEAIAQGQLRSPRLRLLRRLAALFPSRLFCQSPFPLLRL